MQLIINQALPTTESTISKHSGCAVMLNDAVFKFQNPVHNPIHYLIKLFVNEFACSV